MKKLMCLLLALAFTLSVMPKTNSNGEQAAGVNMGEAFTEGASAEDESTDEIS